MMRVPKWRNEVVLESVTNNGLPLRRWSGPSRIGVFFRLHFDRFLETGFMVRGLRQRQMFR